MSVSTGEEEEAPVEATRVGIGRPLRAALLYGGDDEARRAVAVVALAAAAEVRGVMPADDPRTFVELAQAIRDGAPDIVLVGATRSRDVSALSELLEAVRLGCAWQRPAPRVVALAEPKIAEQLRAASGPFAFEIFAEPAAAVRALREQRRASSDEKPLREEVLEDAARSLASSSGGDGLVMDVSEDSTSLVLARGDGRVDAAHLRPLGMGTGGDRVVARAGLDRVRRWLPSAIDAPALLERVFNRSRWPNALPATPQALLLEMALAREAIAHAVRDADYAGLDVAAMRAARSILVTGGLASFPRAAQTLAVLVDGLEPVGISTCYREPDGGRAERIALIVALSSRRPVTLRFIRAAGRSEERIAPGAFRLLPMSGEFAVDASRARVRGQGRAGSLGVLIDARGRPLALPERDGERLPVLTRWLTTLRALPASARG